MRNWLAHNSAYFRDDLIQSALAADNNTYIAVTALRSLARLDWDAARPIAETLASAGEEWFISLFADPTLSGVLEDEAAESNAKATATNEKLEEYTAAKRHPGYLYAVLLLNMDRWLPVVGNLIGHNHRLIHRAAVKCLVNVLTERFIDDKTKKEIAQKLIPWLIEPGWAVEAGRDRFIRGLIPLNMPELAPGLIWILDHDETPYIRALAAQALTKYRGPRAIPALRRALEKSETS